MEGKGEKEERDKGREGKRGMKFFFCAVSKHKG